MANKVYDVDGLDVRKAKWDGDESTGGLPVSGRLVENYIKSIDDKTETTTELVTGETKPAAAGAVADAVAGMVSELDVTDSDDGTQYVMTFRRRKNDGSDEDMEVRFSKYTDDDKVAVSVDLTDSGGSPLPSSQFLPLGSGLVTRYAVGVGTAGGGPVDGYSNLRARVVVKRGNTVLAAFQDAEYMNAVAGQTYTFDAGPYLTDAGAYTIQVEARADYDGVTLSKTASVRVTMVSMRLASTFSVCNGLDGGGYANDATVPFTLTGTTGDKNLYYRLNGGKTLILPLSTGSGTQARNIVVGLAEMIEGRNVLEAYARHEPSGVVSEVFYITLLKAGGGVSDYAGVMFSHQSDGFQASYAAPVMHVGQFTAWSFDYAGYSRSAVKAAVGVTLNGGTVKEDYLLRTERGSYGKTNVTTDDLAYSVVCGKSEILLTIKTTGHPDIEAELATDAVCSFDAFGRSNTESDAAVWRSGDLEMRFEDVLWQVNGNGAGSGWHDNRLLLSNGARMTLTGRNGRYCPFNNGDKPVGQAIADVGMTLEIEFSTANVTDTEAELITCLGKLPNGNRYGLVVTPEEVKFLTGVVTTATDAGETITYEDSVGTKFEPNTNIKIAYTFYPDVSTNEQRTLIGFYVNGVESAASRWTGKVSFDIESELEFNSAGADLLVKNVRIYNKALTDDEVLDNYIVDRNHLEDTEEEKGVRALDEANRVLDESGRVSLQKLLALSPKRKNSCLIFIGTGSVESEVPSASDTMNVLDALAQLNDKKANKLVRKIIFYNGEHPEQSFIAENVFVRIQGTSSVNYSRKNWRIYFQKTASGYTAALNYGEIDSNGVQESPVTTNGKGNLFKLRPDSVGVRLACPKCDFSDSSMTTNTGGARFFNDGMKEMGLLTPAQAYARDHDVQADYRAAIDGIPCDLFCAKSEDEDLAYYGQYNMNNDKSESYPVFGQDKAVGGATWGEGDTLEYLTADEDGNKEYLPIAIETLNNSNPCCLFQWVPSTDSAHAGFMDKFFDGGLEINHPKDVFWNSGKGDADGEPNMKEHAGSGDRYDRMYKSIDRLMSFINRCVAETAAGKNMRYDSETGAFGVDNADEDDKFPASKWRSAYFRAHAREFINVEYSVGYYMFVDVCLGVDQLAKNILWRVWDGRIWYPTWYDGDCQFGNDNKSMLTGKYDDNRQTKRDGAYVMQGHDSWLWNLLIANFADVRETLMTAGINGGASFRSAFSVQKALSYFNTGQMDRWCERLYNKSGIFKYVYPFLNAMPVGSGGTMQTYPQIYGMRGNLKAHRDYFISRRFDLKQVEYGYISTNGAQLYQSTSSQNAGHVLSPVTVRLTIPYRVQIATSNGVQADSGVVPANEAHTLTLRGAFNENDPLKVIGVERIKEFVWHDDAFALGFNFGLFTSLVRLDMSVAAASRFRNASFMTGTETMTLLEELVMTNNMMARNGDSGSVAALDLSHQSRLRKALLTGTGLERVTLATGCPVETLALPDTLTELSLEYLPRLTDGGLELEGLGAVLGYRFAECPGVDGLAVLDRLDTLRRAGNGVLERFSLKVDVSDDGTLLDRYAGYKTYTAAGANDNFHSGLRGRVRLTSYIAPERIKEWQRVYPELTIVQPSYTVIEMDDTVSDPANMSNLDNRTGYRYGTDYVVSGHVRRILDGRHRCLCKDKVIESGKYYACMLHDDNSNYYADNALLSKCSPALLAGSQGAWMVYEPHYWYKGVNDILNNKKYMCFHSGGDKPVEYDHRRVSEDGLMKRGGTGEGLNVTGVQPGGDWREAVADASGYTYGVADVRGWKYVRWTAVQSSMFGALFADRDGKVLSARRGLASQGMRDGMYLFCRVPENAAMLCFTYPSGRMEDVVMTNEELWDAEGNATDAISVMEPDAVEHKPRVCGVMNADENGLSYSKGDNSVASCSYDNFKAIFGAMGKDNDMMSYEQIKDITNLYMAKYGTRLYSGGSYEYGGNVGGKAAKVGMQDTFVLSGSDPLKGAPYYEDSDGSYIRLELSQAMGYPSFFAAEATTWQQRARSFFHGNIYTQGAEVHITGDDGKERVIDLGWTANKNFFPSQMYHGRYMDLIPTGAEGSSTTFYPVAYNNEYQFTMEKRVVIKNGYRQGLANFENKYRSSADDKIGAIPVYSGEITVVEYSEYKNL